MLRNVPTNYPRRKIKRNKKKKMWYFTRFIIILKYDKV